MAQNIIQVDRAKIDNEILDLRSQIDKLTEDLEVRLNLIKYIESITVNGTLKKDNTDSPKQNVGVSEFILSFLNDGGRDTKDIINGYAAQTNSTYGKVSGNVSNALSRLKTSQKINNKLKPGGRKAGSAWFLIK